MTSNMSSTETNTKKDTPAPQPATGGDNVPSGFILKLFQMVNGAPDEVIRVSGFSFRWRSFTVGVTCSMYSRSSVVKS